jgi:hypothetical protein
MSKTEEHDNNVIGPLVLCIGPGRHCLLRHREGDSDVMLGLRQRKVPCLITSVSRSQALCATGHASANMML